MSRNTSDDGAATQGARLVLFDASDPALATGRRERRARVLAMRPTDPARLPVADRGRTFPVHEMHWEFLRRDGVSLLVRARDAVDAEDARWDASRVFATASELSVVYVRDTVTGHLAWWLATDKEPVLVSPRIWLGSQRTGLQSHLRLALAALPGPKSWGRYSRDTL